MKTGGAFLTSPIGSEQIFTREGFSEEQQEFVDLSEEFALNEIYPKRDEIEKRDRELMQSLMQKAGEIGFLGIDVPEKFGGLSLDKVTSAILTESVSLGESASFSVTIAAHVSIGTLPIVFFGTPEQKQQYLPKLVNAELLSAYCLTEPTAGSDALSIRSTAVLSEDKEHYILNGEKQFITNGGWADLYIVFAKVNGEKYTAFIVERDTPGIQVGKEEYKLGQKGASTCSVSFENVKVPVENVLHEIGKGAEVAFNSLNIGRFKLGAADLGGCKASINRSVQYALERWQFGQPIGYFEAIKGKFADMILHTFALDSMLYRTAGLLDQSISQVDPDSPNYFSEVANAIENYAIECSMCKIYGSESLGKVVDAALQVYGGYGFIEEYPMARIYRDGRVDRLYEGTNEINRQVIVGYFLKKAIMDQLPLRRTIQKRPDFAESETPEFFGILADEMHALETAKGASLFLFNHALIKYGQNLMTHQQLGETLSDIFIGIYAMDSCIARVKQYFEANEGEATWLKLAKLYCAEKVLELGSAFEKVIYGVLTGKEQENAMMQIRVMRERMSLPFDMFQVKSELAEELYARESYWF